MLKIFLICVVSFSLTLANGIKKINYEDGFESVNYKGRLGAGIYSNAYFKFDENGIGSGVYLKAKMKLFNHIKEAVKIEYKGTLDPSSFEKTNLGIGLSLFTYEVYHIGSNMLEESNVTIPSVDVNITDINTTAKQKQKRKAAKMKKAKESLANLDSSSALGLNKDIGLSDLNITLAKEYGTTLFIGPIPLYVVAGVGGDVGFNVNIVLEGITKIVGQVTPFAKLGGYAKAGLGSGFSIF